MRISDWSSDVCSSDLPACAVGEARAHRLEIGIEDAARERRAGDMVRTGIVPTCMAREPGLDRLEQLGGDDRWMGAGIAFVLMDDQAKVGAVPEQVEQRPAAERLATKDAAAPRHAQLRAEAAVKMGREKV